MTTLATKTMDRRGFVRDVVSASAMLFGGQLLDAARHPAVGERWAGWNLGEFQVHFIYTGIAESQFLIFPDGTSALLDCGDHPAHSRGKKRVKILPSTCRHAGEWIARYVESVNPNGRNVDYMVLSHFDPDHSGCESHHAGWTIGRNPDYALSGFAQAAETLRFQKAVDRGWPNYDDPIPLAESHGNGSLRNMKALYAHLQRRDGLSVEKFRLGAHNQICPLRRSVAEFDVFNFAVNGRICSPKTGTVVDPCRERMALGDKRIGENAMSAGLLFAYGEFTYYTAGDLSARLDRKTGLQLEDVLAPLMPKVDVAKINHHGHHSMYSALSKALDARCYVACVWDQLHCTPDTMKALEEGSGPHMYFPGIVPTWDVHDGKRLPWMNNVATPCWDGAHSILTVQPGGKRYSMTLLSAEDESLTVKGVFDFQTRTKGCAA